MIKIVVPRTGVELIGLDAIAKHFGYQNIDVLANHLEIDMVVDYRNVPPCFESIKRVLYHVPTIPKPVRNSKGEEFASIRQAAQHYGLKSAAPIGRAIRLGWKFSGMHWEEVTCG